MYSSANYPIRTPRGVGSPYRTYVVFSTHDEWYASLVKWGLKRYQGTTPTFTHCFVLVQQVERKQFVWIEIEYGQCPSMAFVQYDTCAYVDGTISAKVESHDGYTLMELDAFDVTQICGDAVERYYDLVPTEYEINAPLTLMSLIRHLLPRWLPLGWVYPTAWTCSGFSSALIGLSAVDAYLHPMTPDLLYAYCRARLDNPNG